MRTFIAIALPGEIKDSLASLQAVLKKSGADVKWVDPENIHLTLKFLGEVDEEQLAKIFAALQDTAGAHNRFSMHLSSLGGFPKIYAPRVIWVGIDKGEMEVKQLAERLEEKISALGIPAEDRPFSTHITIGRTRSGLNRTNLVRELNDPAAANPLKLSQDFLVTKVTLFKSNLTPKGPVYEVLKEAFLKEC